MSLHERYYGDDAENDKPEVGDTVAFKAQGEFGPVSGEGEVTRLFKNGKAVIEMAGQKYESTDFYLLRRAC